MLRPVTEEALSEAATCDKENISNHKARLGLAIVPLCRGTGAPLRRTKAPPGPFEIFWRVRYGEKFYYRCGPLPTPLVVMIAKLSLIGIPSKNSISLWLVAAAHVSTQGANKDALHSKLYQTVHVKQTGRWQFACPLSHDLHTSLWVYWERHLMPIFSARFWKFSSKR